MNSNIIQIQISKWPGVRYIMMPDRKDLCEQFYIDQLDKLEGFSLEDYIRAWEDLQKESLSEKERHIIPNIEEARRKLAEAIAYGKKSKENE